MCAPRSLTAKTFVNEIKDASDAADKGSASAWSCLQFDMSRADIHLDIFEVVSQAAAAHLHEGPETRVRKFFLAFLHVFFGLKVRGGEELLLLHLYS